MSDWYEKGLENLKQHIVEITDISREDLDIIYSELVNIGLIDYDIEKDIVFDWYESNALDIDDIEEDE